MDYEEYSAHTAANKVLEWKRKGLDEIISWVDAAAVKGETSIGFATKNLNDVPRVIMNLQGRHFKVAHDELKRMLYISWGHL
jgi:oligoendopeptidase F